MELIRVPDIPEGDYPGNEAVSEIKSYLIRLDRRLRLILDDIGTAERRGDTSSLPGLPQVSMSDIKDLKDEIIRTANEIKLTRDVINLKLQNDYVAKSDIGEYTENAIQNIEIDGKGVTQYFSEVGVLTARMDGAENAISGNTNDVLALGVSISQIEAYIRTGKLADGVYGIEIGNFGSGGSSPYKVRLSDNRLAFYIGNSEVAYFSDRAMYISDAAVLSSLSIGNTVLKSEDGLVISCG